MRDIEKLEEKYRSGAELADDEIFALISEGTNLPVEKVEAILCGVCGEEFLKLDFDL